MPLNERIDIVTSVVKGLLSDGLISPSEFMIGVHNSFTHGKLLEEAGCDVTDESLASLFEGFDISIKAMKKMDE